MRRRSRTSLAPETRVSLDAGTRISWGDHSSGGGRLSLQTPLGSTPQVGGRAVVSTTARGRGREQRVLPDLPYRASWASSTGPTTERLLTLLATTWRRTEQVGPGRSERDRVLRVAHPPTDSGRFVEAGERNPTPQFAPVYEAARGRAAATASRDLHTLSHWIHATHPCYHPLKGVQGISPPKQQAPRPVLLLGLNVVTEWLEQLGRGRAGVFEVAADPAPTPPSPNPTRPSRPTYPDTARHPTPRSSGRPILEVTLHAIISAQHPPELDPPYLVGHFPWLAAGHNVRLVGLAPLGASARQRYCRHRPSSAPTKAAPRPVTRVLPPLATRLSECLNCPECVCCGLGSVRWRVQPGQRPPNPPRPGRALRVAVVVASGPAPRDHHFSPAWRKVIAYARGSPPLPSPPPDLGSLTVPPAEILDPDWVLTHPEDLVARYRSGGALSLVPELVLHLLPPAGSGKVQDDHPGPYADRWRLPGRRSHRAGKRPPQAGPVPRRP